MYTHRYITLDVKSVYIYTSIYVFHFFRRGIDCIHVYVYTDISVYIRRGRLILDVAQLDKTNHNILC